MLYVTFFKDHTWPIFFFLIAPYVVAYCTIPHIFASGSNIPHLLHLKMLPRPITFRVCI